MEYSQVIDFISSNGNKQQLDARVKSILVAEGMEEGGGCQLERSYFVGRRKRRRKRSALVPPETMCGELSIPVAAVLPGPTPLPPPAYGVKLTGRRCPLFASSSSAAGSIRNERQHRACVMLMLLEHLAHSLDTSAVLDDLRLHSQAVLAPRANAILH